MTALYLAAKTRESPRQLRDVVNVGYRLMHPQKPPLSVGTLYEALRESVVQCELILLRHLQFDSTFNPPHKVGGGAHFGGKYIWVGGSAHWYPFTPLAVLITHPSITFPFSNP